MVIAVISVIGCQSSAINIENKIACTDPRPEVCTMNYKPVCGYYSDNSIKTYSNACSACSDKKVVAYIDKQCSKE